MNRPFDSRGVALGDLRLQAIFDKHPLCIRPTIPAVCTGKFPGRRAARSASVDQPLARALTSARFSTTWTMIYIKAGVLPSKHLFQPSLSVVFDLQGQAAIQNLRRLHYHE
jgi:hypothetical protein